MVCSLFEFFEFSFFNLTVFLSDLILIFDLYSSHKFVFGALSHFFSVYILSFCILKSSINFYSFTYIFSVILITFFFKLLIFK